ncbi:MAG: MgtC/SapB family protein [Prevotella sp.]|nr:MgtC/SapB family protein [Prevotella sp.]
MDAMTQDFLLRILCAAILGGLVGLEREYRAKEAGFRTHFLVGLGAAVFMILSKYGYDDVVKTELVRLDPSRIAAQVVSGIGFIGAGCIIFQRHVVRGLTTAAGLWVTSAIGLACGSGMYVLATAATILVLLCLEAVSFIHNRFGAKTISLTFSATTREGIREVLDTLQKETVDVLSYEMKTHRSSEGEVYTATMRLKVKRDHYQSRIMSFMTEFDGITIDNIE